MAAVPAKGSGKQPAKPPFKKAVPGSKPVPGQAKPAKPTAPGKPGAKPSFPFPPKKGAPKRGK